MNGIIARIGEFVKRHRDHAWQGSVLLLIAWSGYNLGLIRAHQGTLPAQGLAAVRDGIVSQTPSPSEKGTQAPAVGHTDLRVVVSTTSSSKKYHFSWCSGAKRIKPENQKWFPSESSAQAAGYTLAANCSR